MGNWPKEPEPITEHLARCGTPDCTCPSEWKSLGILYGVGMGNGWVRTDSSPDCPHHGKTAKAAR